MRRNYLHESERVLARALVGHFVSRSDWCRNITLLRDGHARAQPWHFDSCVRVTRLAAPSSPSATLRGVCVCHEDPSPADLHSVATGDELRMPTVRRFASALHDLILDRPTLETRGLGRNGRSELRGSQGRA